MNAVNRRMTDRYPLTQRLHWRAMTWLDRNIGGVAGTLFLLTALVLFAAFVPGAKS